MVSARSSTYFPELESLRGVAILLVFFFHADGVLVPGHGGGVLEAPWSGFLHAGHVGVDLFFVLSGFLLGRPFLAAAATGKVPSIRRYAERRALRILPMYWAAVAVSTILAASTLADLRLGVPYLFFLNSFARWTKPIIPYSIPWWSLATEIQFYVVLPLLPLLLSSSRGRVAGAVLLPAYCAAYLTFHVSWWHMHSIDGQILMRSSVFGRGPLFLLGIAAAWVHLHYGDAIRTRLAAVSWLRAGGADLGMVATYVVLAYLLRWVAYRGFPDVENDHRHMYHAVAGVLWSVLLLAMLLTPLRLKALWSNSVLGTIGVLSYSLYLVHLPILHTALELAPGEPAPGWTLASTARVLILLAGCLGISAITYRLIERPFLTRKASTTRDTEIGPASGSGRSI